MGSRIYVIVQARMTSKRFPGKVLYEVKRKPLLQYLLERLSTRFRKDSLIVATSVDSTDDPVKEFCVCKDVKYYRGSLDNVAGRFCSLINHFKSDTFVRISGDSPMFDPTLASKAIEMFEQNSVDLVTNVFPRSFPKGQSVEVMACSSFLQGYSEFEHPEDFEHVTPYFYRHAERYQMRNFTSRKGHSGDSLAVDTPEDMECFEAMVEGMNRPHCSYGWEELLELKRKVWGNQE